MPRAASVDFVSPTTGYGVAVGGDDVSGDGAEMNDVPMYRGRLVTTTDAGRHWHGVPAPRNVQTACFATPTAGWVGAGGAIYATHNAGATWSMQRTGRPRERMYMDAADVRCQRGRRHLVVVGGAAMRGRTSATTTTTTAASRFIDALPGRCHGHAERRTYHGASRRSAAEGVDDSMAPGVHAAQAPEARRAAESVRHCRHGGGRARRCGRTVVRCCRSRSSLAPRWPVRTRERLHHIAPA